ncbi:hypothetical protein A2U01_0068092, partial [Trifolium medium]|nr:hypothetical protein [Trifolium medium]
PKQSFRASASFRASYTPEPLRPSEASLLQNFRGFTASEPLKLH